MAPGRSTNNTVAIAAVAVAIMVLVAGVSFVAGRLTAPKSAVGPTTTSASLGDISSEERPTAAPVPLGSPGFTVPDPAGDAAPHPSRGRVYGPSDIVSVSIRTDGGYLVITTAYTPETPMDLLSVATRIRMDPEAVPTCKDSVLDSFDWSIDYDTDGVSVFRPGASCDDEYQRTSIAGTSEITGSTLTIKIAADRLGIRPGHPMVVRACASTRIDDHSTTFIQDWAPDSPNGMTGNA